MDIDRPGPDTPDLPDPLPPDDPEPLPEPDPSPIPGPLEGPGVDTPVVDLAEARRRLRPSGRPGPRGVHRMRTRHVAWTRGPDHVPAA